MANGGEATKIVKEKGLVQISDPEVIRGFVTTVLDADEKSVADFKDGKERALKALLGQIMKASKGQANPQLTNQILMEEINKR